MKNNKELLSNPYIHRQAILEGLKSEKISHLVEDLVEL